MAAGEAGASRTPPVSEFTPEVELQAAIYDRIGHLISAVVASAGAKNPPKTKPWPRPRTAFERAKGRHAQAALADIMAKVTPHDTA